MIIHYPWEVGDIPTRPGEQCDFPGRPKAGRAKPPKCSADTGPPGMLRSSRSHCEDWGWGLWGWFKSEVMILGWDSIVDWEIGGVKVILMELDDFAVSRRNIEHNYHQLGEDSWGQVRQQSQLNWSIIDLQLVDTQQSDCLIRRPCCSANGNLPASLSIPSGQGQHGYGKTPAMTGVILYHSIARGILNFINPNWAWWLWRLVNLSSVVKPIMNLPLGNCWNPTHSS